MSKLIIINNNIDLTEDLHSIGTNKPILRKSKIMESLKSTVANVDQIIVEDEINIDWLKKVHDANYLDFLKNCYHSWKLSLDISWTDGKGLVPCNFTRHIPTAILPTYKLSGYYGSDVMTPIYENTYHDAMISAKQAYVGTDYISVNNVVYILATSPGHHAKKSEYGGYCFINNAVVAAQRLIELTSQKVGILDLDYHAGNGTYDMTLDNNLISAYSIHCDPTFDYPSFDGQPNDHNHTLPPKCDLETYIKTLHVVCEKIKNNDINTLIIAFGGDTFKDDPDAIDIGRFSLNITAYKEMSKIIRQYFPTTPILITQEGGYNIEHIGEIVSQFINGLL